MSNWNLDSMYKGFDDDFYKDFENHKKSILELTNYAKENFTIKGDELKKIESYINKLNTHKKLDKVFYFTNLNLSVNSENAEAIKNRAKLHEVLSELSVSETLFQNFLKDLNIDELVGKSEILKEHEFFLKQSKQNASYKLSDAEELVFAKAKVNAASAWTSLHSQLTSTLDVDIEMDGEKKVIPLSLVRSMAKDSNAEIRKKAFEAEMAAYPKIEKPIAAALNAIKGQVNIESELRGYENALDMTLKSSRMDKETLDALLSAMKESLPIFKKYFEHKAKLLGHTNGKLPFYDLFAPLGEEKSMSKEDASKFVVDNFMNFSEDMGKFTENAIKNDWVDWFPRKGKVGGAFCSNIHSVGESRVLMNFNGNFDEVITLAHEFGHAYHGEALKNAVALNSDYSMPIAEVASTFCETIVLNAALETATNTQKLAILENSLQGASQIIVDIYSRFLFEDTVIKKRKEGNLSVEELKNLMLEAQKETYGEAISNNHEYMWINKGHYYRASVNYYNFPYAYGLLFAKGLYSIFKKEGSSFAPKYKDLLTATGKNSLYEVGKIVGIDVHDIEFWRTSIKEIELEIEEFIKLGV